QPRIGRYSRLLENVDRWRVDVVVIAGVGQRLEPLLLEFEIDWRGDHSRVHAAADQRGGAAIDVGSDRRPLDVSWGHSKFRKQPDGVVIGRVADLADAETLAFQIADR